MAAVLYPNPCPVCTANLGAPFQAPGRGFYPLACPNCGEHRLSAEACEYLNDWKPDLLMRARLGYAVRRLKSEALITVDWLLQIRRLAQSTKLPEASKQLDNFIRYAAESCRPGQRKDFPAPHMCAVLGAVTPREAQWVMQEAMEMGLIRGIDTSKFAAGDAGLQGATLTVEGRQRYDEIMREGAGSAHAFMAMRFSKAMQAVFEDHMRPAVARAGFELRTAAGDHKTAGSIDNRMRVEIRTSRFLVCDLSDGNRGAYWEAGFAEGLGRPVFYTCRADVLRDKAHEDHPHFDTAHERIIAWDPAGMAAGMSELTAVIRNTLPAEAKMQDE